LCVAREIASATEPVQPARDALAAFGRQYDQVGRVQVDEMPDALDRRLWLHLDFAHRQPELRDGVWGFLLVHQTPRGERVPHVREGSPLLLVRVGDMQKSEHGFG